VAGQVTLDDGTTVPFCIGCSADSPLEGKLPPTLGTTNKPKGRLYWYIEK
jgi:type IV pilus assembly protein PilY1